MLHFRDGLMLLFGIYENDNDTVYNNAHRVQLMWNCDLHMA